MPTLIELGAIRGTIPWFVGCSPIFSLWRSTPQRLSVKARPILPVQVWLGSILIVVSLSIFLAVDRWMSSRTFTALDMPTSLAKGHINSGPFKINLRSEYQVEMDTAWQRTPRQGCPADGEARP
jgi:hypothetical protein